ncbi:MAG: TusE/DsrC/DsvC family sulfur relay protein [Sedimenticolaceae bacterium]|jgi:tRNA 2-thiouridine synthesizing protein E
MSLAAATYTTRVGATAVLFDDDGFLLDCKLWNRTLAQQLADRSGIGRLGSTHWMIIDFVRDRYFRLGAMPPMRNMCRRLGVDRDAVKKAFGSCRDVWQIAGLPNPGGEALAYMD